MNEQVRQAVKMIVAQMKRLYLALDVLNICKKKKAIEILARPSETTQAILKAMLTLVKTLMFLKSRGQ